MKHHSMIKTARDRSTLVAIAALVAFLALHTAAFAAADNEWGPGYQVTPSGLRINGIKADNPQNRVIFDNDWFFDDFGWLVLSAQDKLGKIDLRGIITTRDPQVKDRQYPHIEDYYQKSVYDYNMMRDLAIESGLNVPRHTDGAREPLARPGNGKINRTKYTLSDGARLIIREADASTPNNPLLVFVGGQNTTVATALLEKPSIANKMIVFFAGDVSVGYNSEDGWACYVTAMRAPFINCGAYWGRGSHPVQLDPLPDNPVIRALREVKDCGKKHDGVVGAAPLAWLFDQSLVTGAQKRQLTGTFKTNDCPLARNDSGFPYGHLRWRHIHCKFEEMIDLQVDMLKDPRVWEVGVGP